jgi:hypothetical protein
MAYDNDQNEYPLPADGKSERKSESLLPRYFRTDVNKKFLQSTLDQLTQPGVAEKLNGYYGRRISKAFNPNDNYVGDVSTQRENYQFEPVTLIKDDLGNTTFYRDYNDYLNQIKSFGGNVDNQEVLNGQEYYAWNPNIDWDKFTNFREYYWLPYGPQTIRIAGQSRGVESTVAVKLINNVDNNTYSFSTDELVNNPTLILYRGQTYTFDITAPGNPLTIKTKRTLDTSFNYDDGVSAQAVEKGKITITVRNDTPEVLYYVAEDDINNSGLIQIRDIEENTEIDVEREVIGKTSYTTKDGLSLSNGMKISFAGFVTPEIYGDGDWYVEGVGTSIRLIKESSLEIPGAYSENRDLPFDTNAFDRLPFANANGYPATKDYIVINRGSLDKNMWSRYNRWFHKDVIELSAEVNGQTISVDQAQRATRPIIEFSADLKLMNFGTVNKTNVDLIDTFTKDIFSTIEGSIGYNIDGVDLVHGMRVLFTAEEDIREAGKIFKVTFIIHKGRRQISLVEEEDSVPLEGETVLALSGETYQGRMFYYDGNQWNLTQEKTTANQQPLFELFDDNGVSYADYDNSTFTGNMIFSYAVGSGIDDTELGFPLTYRSIENVGDVVFNFDLLKRSFTYTDANLETVTLGTDNGFLHKHTSREEYESINGWTQANIESTQRVLRQYVAVRNQTDFAVDVYDNSAELTDLNVCVTVNNDFKFEGTDFEIVAVGTTAVVRFNNSLNVDDVVVLKTRSDATKNKNGVYELPGNLERNPLNNDVDTFTLGEVNEHVSSIVQEADEFFGAFPGAGNLRDIANPSQYGRKFLQHTGPINLALYHITDKSANIVKAIEFARREYAKFKRLFLQTSTELGFDGTPKAHVDLIFKELNKNKTSTLPFYFSDMVPTGGARVINYNGIPNNKFYALNEIYDVTQPDVRAVIVYLNDEQLVYGRDYTFNADGFCEIEIPLTEDDQITIYEYENTDGSYVPPTPTKLGMYPKFIPTKFVDDTYLTPTEVIQGHDGSITRAYGDYRDDLLLELEKRIFNNLKVEYDTEVIDIHSFIPGANRNTKVSIDSINSIMLKDFASWLSTVGNVDYTDFSFYERENRFSYNYGSMNSPTGELLPGFWRAVYKYAFDTDRPHTHPWEMLGFTIKPNWWDEKYGIAPYTSNNLLMWEDLEKGVIAEPGVVKVIVDKYKRPGLTSHIPVDTQGNLLSPLDSGYAKNYVNRLTRSTFVFGDEAPVETAWRRSSEYAFSLFKAWLLIQPAKITGLGFDRLRVQRNSANQIVYSETGKRIRLEDLVFPNNSTLETRTRTYTSGFINLIANYLASNILVNYEDYQDNIKRISNQMAFKIGGFTDKTKFNLILDSRTPLSEGNVFVPDENYEVILQTSSPIEVVTYSGVVIEKATSGYIIRGYDASNPSFTYYNYQSNEKDPTVNVGGISDSYIEWDDNKRYIEGVIVRYNSQFYRTKVAHTSTQTFDATKFVRLPFLPLTGGRSAIFRSEFEKTFPKELPYGTLLRTSQEVVDFLLGYGEYLKDLGFVFDNFNNQLETVENWKLSAREFLFWTLQSWDAGSLITLSPSADKIQFKRDSAVVDNVFDTFYDYGLVKADGTKLKQEFCNIFRQSDNTFVLSLKNTADGIYALKLPLVQTEHVVLLDNETEFKDVIYDPEPGYRQERIRVLGYRTADWEGGLNVPGFIYDQATVTEWTPYKDYAIGDVVKYKEFYYTATSKVSGTRDFESSRWYRLAEKPEPKLLTNLEYKTNQFADFYDLDTDNFDVGQQEIAQHLIGYQKREYLANIINDDVSQYKFYQGMIQDKGTRNALTKLFDALGAADKESLEFYEEWAVRVGQYGAADGFEEVEFKLNEEEMKISPQPVLLTDTITGDETDLVYRQTADDVYVKTKEYTHTPFPTRYLSDTPIKTAGYVRETDVQFTVKNKEDILALDIAEVAEGDYIWVTFEGQEWNVYKHVDTIYIATGAIPTESSQAEIILDKISSLSVGDYIGLKNVADIDGFYEVIDVNLNRVTIDLGDNVLTTEETGLKGVVTTLLSNRVAQLTDANKYAETDISVDELIWVDDAGIDNKWNVLKASNAYNFDEDIFNPTENNTSFGDSMATDADNKFVAVGSPADGEGKVHIYKREDDGSTVYGTLQPHQTLEPIANFDNGASKFGDSVTMSPDGKYIVVGAPEATYVKSAFKDNFNFATDYKLGAIVQYNGGLYKSRRRVFGRTDNVVFGTFDSVSRWRSELYKQYNNYLDFPIITTGDYPLQDVTTDHMLVRAPSDAYEGSNVGDKVYFDWNDISDAYIDDYGIEIVGLDMGNPVTLTTNRDHGLVDGDRVILTDFPNDNLTFRNDTYDNSDVNVPFDTIEQQGVKGFEGFVYYVKKTLDQQVELYRDADLTTRVNGTVGFTGEPIGADASNFNLGDGSVQGVIRKINLPFNNEQAEITKQFLTETVHTIRRKVEEVFYIIDPVNVPNIPVTIITTGTIPTTNLSVGDIVGQENNTVFGTVNSINGNTLEVINVSGIFKTEGQLINRTQESSNDWIDLGSNTVPASVSALIETGARVTTSTGNATVAYVRKELGRLVIYANDKNGIFDETGSLYINDQFLIGDYVRPLHDEVDRSDVLGGWWEIATDNSYVPGPNTADYAYGLVISDVKNNYNPNTFDSPNPAWKESSIRLPYNSSVQNTLDNPIEVLSGVDKPFQKETDLIRVLSHKSQGIGGNVTEVDVLDDRWIVRLPKNVSDKASTDSTLAVGVFLNDIRDASGNLIDLSDRGFGNDPYSIINRVEAPVDLWDGYIDYDQDVEVDFQVGDTVREGQTGATATVTYYQRDLDKCRIYVKNVAGTFTFGSRYIGGVAPESMWLYKQVGSNLTRVGTTESRQLADSDIGKLAVFRHTENLEIPPKLTYAVTSQTDEIADYETKFISGIEYHTWIEEYKPGLPRNTLAPSTENNDWAEVNNIPINVGRDASTFVREGAFFVYEYNTETDNYDLVNGYILPNRYPNRRLASEIKLINNNNFYKLLLNSQEHHIWDTDTAGGNGRIYFVVHGSNEFGTYDWQLGKNQNFKGVYSNNDSYYEGQIVIYNDVFYKALTNLGYEEFDNTKWQLLSDHIDFVGYLPNTSGYVFPGDDSSIVNLATSNFGRVFDISESGNILATIAEYSTENKLVIYKLKDNHFEYLTEFSQPTNSRGFGSSIAVSNSGNLIAVSAPDTDAENLLQGKVYVYKNTSGTFNLYQTLESPNKELAEGFGYRLGFDGNQLIVSGSTSDIILETTFDRYLQRNLNAESEFGSKYVNNPQQELSVGQTTYDNGFTTFVSSVQDSGIIYLYENINDSLVFGQRLKYNNFNVTEFGKNAIVQDNAILVGLPTLEGGKVAVYIKDPDQRVWNVHRSPVDPVDVEKMRGSFIYDTEANEMLARLDIIDPILGKVAGIAEQELSYKTYFDPANYNVGNASDKEALTAWAGNNVGKLWWDLSTIKFVDYHQGDIVYSNNIWGNLAEGASVDVYEWVESRVIPSQWDSRADTNQGVANGYSGTTKYGDTKYVEKDVYDSISQSFSKRYYFWVKDTKIVPNVENRSKTAYEIANIIRDPAGQRLRFVSILGNDRFVLYNSNRLTKDRDVAINFRYWTIDNQDNNIHTEYQIITDGLDTSRPKTVIEDKWFDSLIGADKYHREVPDTSLSVKQKYGNMNRPRQSWFINRQEALKQFIERVNRVLANELAVDNLNINKLFDKDPIPSDLSGLYDTAIDTEEELRLVGTVRATQAVLEPVVVDGTVTSVNIINAGRGYRISPKIEFVGTGDDLELRANINTLGIITSVDVINGGTNYKDDLTLSVRPLSALVRADSTLGGKWSIYAWDESTRTWSISKQEYYTVADYWDYKDWYADGYSSLTSVDFLIDDYYQLNIIQDDIGDIVKISNVGEGGWILLEKIVNVDTPDYTTGYKTVGRENGTVEFSSKLYTQEGGSTELRKILETIRDDLFVDELANEYNQLFFASLRYVLSEQNYADWLFKTSFIKAKHNVGELIEKTTYQNDNLPSFEAYVEEVKPYKTKIREYLSAYSKTDNTQSVITDFELSPFYDPERREIVSPKVTINEGVLSGINFDVDVYPQKHWIDNFTYEVEEILIEDGGSGYTEIPLVTISGGGGTGATARAFIGSGAVKSIVVDNGGSGYISVPTVNIEGTQAVGGRQPRVSVVLGNKKIRTVNVKQKFDRITPNFETLVLKETETFVSTGTELKLKLKYPMDLTRANVRVFINDVEALDSEYSYNNESELASDGLHTHELGYILLEQSRVVGTVIRVEYNKGYELLSAADRINLLYNPETGQYGKDLGQLMDGVDYGGVEVRSFEFGQDLGYDTQPWYTSEWDTYDENFDDETFYTDGSTTKFQLSKPLAEGETYNIYVNGIRIDDPNYDGSTKTYIAEDGSTVLALGNPNAIMKSVTTESSEYIVETNNGIEEYFIKVENIESWESLYDDTWYNPPSDDVVVVIRKSTSDGSFLPSGAGFDTLIEGGNLQYGTATGLDAGDITIDGDGFVTATTSKGPEELVPGQLHDTLDLKVYDRVADGGSLISTRNYTATSGQTVFDLAILPHNIYSLIIKVNGSILTEEDFEIDYANKEVTLTTPLTLGDKVNISSMSGNGERILDIDNFTGDGTTRIFVTNTIYQEGIQSYITVDGLKSEVALFETDSSYGELEGLVGLEFVTAPEENAFIYYALYDTNETSELRYSATTVNRFVGDGSTVGFELAPEPASRLPLSHNVVVKIDDKILYPGYTQQWYIVSDRSYQLDTSQWAGSSLAPDLVDVYINGRKLKLLTDYNWDFANTQVVLFDNVGEIGDDLEVVIPSTAEYTFSKNSRLGLINVQGSFEAGETVTIGYPDSTQYTATVKSYNSNILTLIGEIPGLAEAVRGDDTVPVEGQTSGATSNLIQDFDLIEAGDSLILNEAPAEGENIDVFAFTRHEIQDIQMETKTNVSRRVLTIGSDDYYEAHRRGRGLIQLREPAVDTAYVWVVLNGTLLTANRDYKLVKLDSYVQITRPLAPNDIVQVIHFAAPKSTEKFGFRMFKDMLNRTHYKRLNKDNIYTLAEPLNATDKGIVLADATDITIPDVAKNNPGVLFIEGERIEYFQVNGNTLSQLRRGTLGTGVRTTYEVGTELMDQSDKETVPYKDEMVSLIALEDESTDIVLDWLPTKGVDEFEIFVGGRRLRKNSISAYQFQEVDADGNLVTGLINKDSPEGDITLEPEFTLTIENDTAIVNLAETPETNSRILIVRKIGKTWQKTGEQLRYSEDSIARFIRGATTDLPK